MTNEEARAILIELRLSGHFGSVKNLNEALETAIKALEQQPCEDAISREAVIKIVEQYPFIIGNRYSGLIADIEHLPSVAPSHEDLKEAYIKGYDYGVKDWFKAKTDKPDIKAEIINRIEQVRDMDKNVGEYPYNRCIEIIREVMG